MCSDEHDDQTNVLFLSTSDDDCRSSPFRRSSMHPDPLSSSRLVATALPRVNAAADRPPSLFPHSAARQRQDGHPGGRLVSPPYGRRARRQ